MSGAAYAEWQTVAAAEALAVVDCPQCDGRWYQDVDEAGCPYTCFCCGNGTRAFHRYEAAEDDPEAS